MNRAHTGRKQIEAPATRRMASCTGWDPSSDTITSSIERAMRSGISTEQKTGAE